MNKNTKLYNVIFPFWLLVSFPISWIFLIVFPANFAIDFLVVLLSLKFLKVENFKEIAKKVIFKVWIMGFVADIIGSVLMFTVACMMETKNEAFNDWWYENVTNSVCYNPFENIFAFLIVTVFVAFVGFLIYEMNFRWCLKKADLTFEQKRRVALNLAFFTAPYLFYLPTMWFY